MGGSDWWDAWGGSRRGGKRRTGWGFMRCLPCLPCSPNLFALCFLQRGETFMSAIGQVRTYDYVEKLEDKADRDAWSLFF